VVIKGQIESVGNSATILETQEQLLMRHSISAGMVPKNFEN
jgi:sRNA-binding regulator protein Hfq